MVMTDEQRRRIDGYAEIVSRVILGALLYSVFVGLVWFCIDLAGGWREVPSYLWMLVGPLFFYIFASFTSVVFGRIPPKG